MVGATSPKPLRVLTLDGGGVRGLTSLLILQRIWRTMYPHGTPEPVPRPCDIFDLIVGTSTGGLIAILLGRLHFSIDECILYYERVGVKVFGEHVGTVSMVLRSLRKKSGYRIETLATEIQDILAADKKMDRKTPFVEADPKCRVYVNMCRTSSS